jgi:hypothetical protein
MKNLLIAFFLGVIILSACGGTMLVSQPTSISVVEQATLTSSPLPTATPKSIPSETPTASITPLPTISTFTPTFDVSTIVTVTPAEKAECPKEDPGLAPTFYVPLHPGCFDTDRCVFSGTDKEILEYLNEGGTIPSAIAKLKTAIRGDYQEYAYQDVTNDGIYDLIFIDFSMFGTLHILYCNNGMYQAFSSPVTGAEFLYDNQKILVQDLNLNSVPDVIFLQLYGNSLQIHTFEWDGSTFQGLSPSAETGQGITVEDVDQNGTKEIIATGIISLYGFYGYPYFGSSDFNIPQIRLMTYVYSWNGANFVFSSEKFEAPQYRFQATQDGDYEALLKEYDQALLLYQDAIFSNELNWWSPAQYEFMKNKYYNSNATLPPAPVEDTSEYPRLAAYAYYRIMLLHLVQGNESEVATTYNTLQQKFGNDPYGSPYAEMASVFWKAYQSTHKMYDGCAAAIQYAAEHPEILTPLGSDYHGSQSHIYVPADVCPFR